MKRYAFLRQTGDAAFFQAAVLTDHTFLLAAPMWIVAVVAVLTGPSLFPDETDFRVLTGLPVERRVVFGAKLAALGLFAGIFLVIAQVSLLPVFLMTADGTTGESVRVRPVARVPFRRCSWRTFAALSVTAVHAMLLLAVPRERLMPLSAAFGSAMLFGLVMALPFVGRIPSFHTAFASGATWLYVFPPAWFVGLERWLVGDARFAALAASAIGALFVAASVAGAAYSCSIGTSPRDDASRGGPGRTAPAMAVAHITPVDSRPSLRRSIIHRRRRCVAAWCTRAIFVAISAIGAAIVANSLLDLDFSPRTVSAQLRLRDAVLWAPFALSFVAILAVRAALFMPIDLRANWVFRITERPRDRADQLDASVSTVWRLGVLLPAALLLPVQWRALGPVAMLTMLVSVLCGWLLAKPSGRLASHPLHVHLHRRQGFHAAARAPWISGVRRLHHRRPRAGLRKFREVAGLRSDGVRTTRSRRPWASPPSAHASIVEPLQFEDALPTDANALKLSRD